MAESPKAADEKTAPPRPSDPRLIPGGYFDAPDIGVNAFDRDDLPSYGRGDIATGRVQRRDVP